MAPWRLQLHPSKTIPISDEAAVLVVNPVCYMAQKLLINPERRGNKKAQDILYLNDTLELFGKRMDSLRECWLNDVLPTLSTKQRNAIEVAIMSMFDTLGNPIREAALIPDGRRITASEIQMRCSVGLAELFLDASTQND